MKVRITFEITDTDRVAISVAQGGGFRPETREGIEAFISDAVTKKLSRLRERFQLATEEIMDEVAE